MACQFSTILMVFWTTHQIVIHWPAGLEKNREGIFLETKYILITKGMTKGRKIEFEMQFTQTPI